MPIENMHNFQQGMIWVMTHKALGGLDIFSMLCCVLIDSTKNVYKKCSAPPPTSTVDIDAHYINLYLNHASQQKFE